MGEHESQNRRNGEVFGEELPRHKLFRLQWRYLRGWLVIAVVVFAAKLMARAFSEAADFVEPLLGSRDSSVWSISLTVVALVFVPWMIGLLTEIPWQRMRAQRGFRALQQMEHSLSKEFRPDESRGYQVAIVNFHSPEVRTLGLVTSTFREPDTNRELAAVYLPGTPDPTKGAMHVVAVDDLVVTDWTFRDLIDYHLTFGSGAPA